MPLYEYECTACRNRFERSQKFSDPPVTECPECGGAVRKVIYPAGVVFKGSGWYITDSRSSTSNNGKSDSDAKDGVKVDGKSDTKTESKGESKGESKTASSTPAKTEGSSSATATK